MVNEIKNSLNGSGLKVAIAVARFNEVVTDKLLEGAVRQLELLGVADKDIRAQSRLKARNAYPETPVKAAKSACHTVCVPEP